jgi:hypothetical protein
MSAEEIKKLTKYVKEVRDAMKELDGKLEALNAKSDKQDELLNEVLDELRTMLIDSDDDDDDDDESEDEESDEDEESEDEESEDEEKAT